MANIHNPIESANNIHCNAMEIHKANLDDHIRKMKVQYGHLYTLDRLTKNERSEAQTLLEAFRYHNTMFQNEKARILSEHIDRPAGSCSDVRMCLNSNQWFCAKYGTITPDCMDCIRRERLTH